MRPGGGLSYALHLFSIFPLACGREKRSFHLYFRVFRLFLPTSRIQLLFSSTIEQKGDTPLVFGQRSLDRFYLHVALSLPLSRPIQLVFQKLLNIAEVNKHKPTLPVQSRKDRTKWGFWTCKSTWPPQTSDTEFSIFLLPSLPSSGIPLCLLTEVEKKISSKIKTPPSILRFRTHWKKLVSCLSSQMNS